MLFGLETVRLHSKKYRYKQNQQIDSSLDMRHEIINDKSDDGHL